MIKTVLNKNVTDIINDEDNSILLKITVNMDNDKRILVLSGPIKTNVAEAFSKNLMEQLHNSDKLILDFSDVAYMASAGLRALLTAQQYIDDIDNSKDMEITNINSEIRDVFESTGFINILNVID